MTEQRTPSKLKRKRQPCPLPPHVNARNLAIEKQRREALNEGFLDLARLLPGLSDSRRLSKVQIVKESVRHLRRQRNVCIAAAREIQAVLAKNQSLISEVNILRAQTGDRLMDPGNGGPRTEGLAQLLSLEHEVYGTFPAGFGDNWAIGLHRPGKDPAQAEEVQISLDDMASEISGESASSSSSTALPPTPLTLDSPVYPDDAGCPGLGLEEAKVGLAREWLLAKGLNDGPNFV